MTTQATTDISARITRDVDDFQAEIVHYDANGHEVDAYLVGWFSTHAAAYEAANQELTETLQARANEAAMAEALLEAQIAQVDAVVAELDEDANYCECCGVEADAAAAELVGLEMHCADCAANTRRAYRDALAAQGAAQDDAMDAAEVEAWLREQPSDLNALRLEVCAVTGDHIVVDQLGRVLKRESDGAAAYLWLCEMRQLAAHTA